MSKYLWVVLCMGIVVQSFGQLPFTAGSISPQLKNEAHSVIRLEELELDIKDVNKGRYSIRRVITVLDAAGKDELTFEYFADKFNLLDEADIIVYNAAGIKIQQYNRKDLVVRSAGSGVVPEGKIYYYQVPVNEYPVTIEYNYSIILKGIYSYRNYYMQQPGQSVEKSSYQVKVPKEIDLRYKAMNISIQPEIDESDKKIKIYKWSINSLAAKKYQSGSGHFTTSFPWILVAPNKFELDGYPGEMNSWKSMGLWYNTLVKNDNSLSPAFRTGIQQLTSHATTDKEKAQIIYTYLQKNFRYVSIQLGIGGFKPFSADFVHQKKYGDCKALSNYMQACLQAVNIKSYSAWIKADRYPSVLDPDFPQDPFNHQIVCIPFPHDTIWLECTSSTNKFGVLGSFTENRSALLLTEDGGVLVNTPSGNALNNHLVSHTIITLQEDGSGSIVTQIKNTGEFEQQIKEVEPKKKNEQKDFIVNRLQFIQPDDFEWKYNSKNAESELFIYMKMEKIHDFNAGNTFFLHPRMYTLWDNALPEAKGRTEDFFFGFPFIKTDTTVYILPSAFTLETLPKAKMHAFEYGKFTTTYQFDEEKHCIITSAQLILHKGKIPLVAFLDAKQFFNNVLNEYTEKIVIKKS